MYRWAEDSGSGESFYNGFPALLNALENNRDNLVFWWIGDRFFLITNDEVMIYWLEDD